jgi:NADP-dependent 3-hydroxy acid dehydrogenase YdfG
MLAHTCCHVSRKGFTKIISRRHSGGLGKKHGGLVYHRQGRNTYSKNQVVKWRRKGEDMSDLGGKVVLITEASSGIGEATARVLAKQGAHVFLGARRTERLQKIVVDIQREGGTAYACVVDVTKRADVERFVQTAVQHYGRIDVIVNNAGVMLLSALETLKVDEWERMIDVNIRGVLYGIAAGLPVMKNQGFGHFVNVSSVGAYQVSPTAAVYCATKFAVNALSEGLRQENSDIRVTIVSPGVTESELADSISDPAAREAMVTYRKVSIPADAVAEAIRYALVQPQNVDVNELVVRPTATTQQEKHWEKS